MREMTTQVTMQDGRIATLTDEHSASSYGQPVLLLDGVAYGPDDAIPDDGRYAWAALDCARLGTDDYWTKQEMRDRFRAASPTARQYDATQGDSAIRPR